MIKNKSKKVKIVDLSVYKNKLTGESLVSEMPIGTKIKIVEETGDFSLKSTHFASIDIDNLKNCLKEYPLSSSDLGHLLKLSLTTHKPENIIYNYNLPHTNESLQEYLGFKSKASYFELIKRLINSEIVYKYKSPDNKRAKYVYILNPYISKSKTLFSRDVINKVRDFGVVDKKSLIDSFHDDNEFNKL